MSEFRSQLIFKAIWNNEKQKMILVRFKNKFENLTLKTEGERNDNLVRNFRKNASVQKDQSWQYLNTCI